MAQIIGTRIGLTTYTAGTDARPGRAEHNDERALLESLVVIGAQGTEAARPTAGKGRALYWNADRSTLQWDTGAQWQDISTNGGGGPGQLVTVAATGTGTEGISERSARADHTHVLRPATASAAGAMSAADKSKLDGATVAATISRLIIRDSAGRAQVASPVAAADIANRGFVESIVGGAAAPVVSTDNNGLATPTMLAATARVDAADVGNSAGTLVVRDAAGRFQASTPAASADVAPKSYVDSSLASQRHDASHIITGTLNAARLPLVTVSAHGAMSNTDKSKLDNATDQANVNTLVLRSAAGTFQSAAPTSLGDVTNKSYVDTQIGTRAPSSHSHNATNITSGTMSTARLPSASSTTSGIIDAATFQRITSHDHDASAISTGVLGAARLPAATPSIQGALSASDKAKLDTLASGTIAENANTVPVRTSTGTVRGATPTHTSDLVPRGYMEGRGYLSSSDFSAGDTTAVYMRRWASGVGPYVENPDHNLAVANKQYVDGKTWDASDVTSGYFAAGRVNRSSYAYNTAWSGVGVVKAVHVRDGSYELCYYSSTQRHKTNVTPWTPDPDDLLAAEPVEFNRIDPATGTVNLDQREVGVLAEQAGQRLPNFVELDPEDLDEHGRPQVTGWSYAQWTTAHQVLHRHHAKRDTHQDARLARIEEALGLEPLTETEG